MYLFIILQQARIYQYIFGKCPLSTATRIHPVISHYRIRYFQHAHFIPIVGVGKRGVYYLVHGDLPRQRSFGTTLRFTGPVPAESRQSTPSVRVCVTR